MTELLRKLFRREPSASEAARVLSRRAHTHQADPIETMNILRREKGMPEWRRP